ncbi:HEAT repeat-containing protein 3-like [Acanthaster planci]|uniref:HEAT repeat-containing protein 3-like n=1 Tax=Acanthaster planci TaxID=133434 RepID=A0A8B7XNC5_ACAPL|nr:HEAT repeat-containing protein 3-like [Acanthaster planci]
MGKAKHKRFRAKKQRPTGLPSVQEVEAEESELGTGSYTAVENQTLTLLERLQSSSDEEKVCSCSALANLVQEPAARDTLLQNGLVRCLGPLLLDNRPAIREAATGALRNLSACGDHEVCDKMVSDDIMTPLVTLLSQLSSGIPIPSGKKLPKRDPNLNSLLQALHLLWNLCESNGTAVSIFNRHGLVHITLQCLQSHVTFLDLALTAAHCLQTVSEDNPNAGIELTKSTALPILESALMSPGDTMQHTLLRTLVASVLHNIKGLLPAVSQNQTIQAIVKVFCQSLDTDAQAAVSKLLPEMSKNGQVSNGSGSPDPKDSLPAVELPKNLSEDLAEIEAVLTAQQVALEVASNMCCLDDDEEDDWEDIASSSSSSDDLQDEITDADEVPFMSPLCLSDEIHGALVSHNLPQKVLVKCAFPDRALLQSLIVHSAGKTIFKGLLRVQSRALLCLQNMIAVIDLVALGGPEALTLVLNKLLILTMVEPAPTGDELVEALTSALRSVLQKMAINKQMPQALSEQHLTRLFGLGQGTQSEQVRVNIVAMLGSLGSLLAAKPETEQLLTAVGTQLSEVAMKDGSLWVTAEALDAIFDTFGDGATADAVAVKIGLVPKLKMLVPQLKARLRQGKNQLGEHMPVVINARHNLVRFIKYKESH